MYPKLVLFLIFVSLLNQHTTSLFGATDGRGSPLSVLIEEHEGMKQRAVEDITGGNHIERASSLNALPRHQHNHHQGSRPALVVDTKSAVLYALENNNGLKAARLNIDRAQAKHASAGKWKNPSFSANFSSDALANDEGERDVSFVFEQAFPITDHLKVSQYINAIEIDLARAEVENHERLLIAEIEKAFIDIAKFDALIKLRQSLIALTQEHLTFAQSRVDRGEINPLEINQLQLDYFALKQEESELNNEREEIVDHLRPLLMLQTHEGIQIKTTLKSMSELQADFNRNRYESKKHPQVKMLHLMQEIAAQEIDLALKKKWEDISLKLFVENERSVDAPRGIDNNQFLGIGLSIPLPLWNRYEGKTQETQLRRQQLQLQKEALLLELDHKNHTLREHAKNLLQQYSYFERNIKPLSERNAKEAEDAYQKGQLTLTAVFQAEKTKLKLASDSIKIQAKTQTVLLEWLTKTGSILNSYKD